MGRAEIDTVERFLLVLFDDAFARGGRCLVTEPTRGKRRKFVREAGEPPRGGDQNRRNKSSQKGENNDKSS